MTADSEKRQAPWACGRCPARWWGLGMAHCDACHSTFGGVTGFDLHQPGGRCITLGQLRRRFEQLRPGVWSLKP